MLTNKYIKSHAALERNGVSQHVRTKPILDSLLELKMVSTSKLEFIGNKHKTKGGSKYSIMVFYNLHIYFKLLFYITSL